MTANGQTERQAATIALGRFATVANPDKLAAPGLHELKFQFAVRNCRFSFVNGNLEHPALECGGSRPASRDVLRGLNFTFATVIIWQFEGPLRFEDHRSSQVFKTSPDKCVNSRHDFKYRQTVLFPRRLDPCLHVLKLAGEIFRHQPIAIGRDLDHILDAYAEAALRQINTRLDGDDGTYR